MSKIRFPFNSTQRREFMMVISAQVHKLKPVLLFRHEIGGKKYTLWVIQFLFMIVHVWVEFYI